MMGPVLRTIDDLAHWCDVSFEAFGDASKPVAVCFARWTDNLEAYRGEDIAIGRNDPAAPEDYALRLGPGCYIAIRLQQKQAFVNAAGELEIFGANEVTDGVWSLTPSLNMPGLIHCFLVLYAVPETADFVMRDLVRIR